MNGATPLSAVVHIYELNNSPASGLITVKLAKDPKINFVFSPTATMVGGTMVQNVRWNFDSTSDQDYYILTSTVGIAAGSGSGFGLSGTFNYYFPGTLTFSAVLAPGSGGDVSLVNNTDAEQIQAL